MENTDKIMLAVAKVMDTVRLVGAAALIGVVAKEQFKK